MTVGMKQIALFAAFALAWAPGVAGAFPDCPADHVLDGYTCTELKGVGKQGGYFRVTFPSDWDGDLVIANHGFDLNDKNTRAHEVCSHNTAVTCAQDSDCGPGNYCNNISYMGLDEILLPKGKAIAAGTYRFSGWAVFGSAKDIKDIIKFVKKDPVHGKDLKRVLITGFSGGGAVTGDAILKLKIDGAVPLCAAVGGGLPTWDVAGEIRLVYDFLCDGVGGANFQSQPDLGEPNSNNSSSDATSMALKVDACFGNIGFAPDDGFQDQRLADFLALTQFDGLDPIDGDPFNLSSAMGFATLGLGDFVRDEARLKGQRIGLNDTLVYDTMGTDPLLAADYDAGVQRLTAGKGRKTLSKYSNPDFTKGKGAKVDYPVMMMAGARDWLVLPEFGNVFTTAMTTGAKPYTQTWIDTYGHCVFTEEETTAVFNKFFEWLGPVDGAPGTQPTAADVAAECIAVGGVDGDTCNFNNAFVPGNIYDRIPPRADWPAAAKP
jgi:hypothetical protein